MPLWAMMHIPPMIFVFCFGACVGSFTNVVIYRLPAGMSVINPPSRCPTCGARLRFFRENLPILGWFFIRGKCRYCGEPVSPQYMIIEIIMALVFVGLYAVLFLPTANAGWLAEIGGPWWTKNMFFRVWPAYFALALLFAGLLAMTVIDARTFTIPIEIPVFVTIAAFVLYAIQPFVPHRAPAVQTWPIPAVGWTGALTAFGGMLGTIVSIVLLRLGIFRYSFADYHEYVEEGETLGDYPHARREMLVELLYLVPILVGLGAGWGLSGLASSTPPPELIQALGGSMLGYVVGGAFIWGIRILGTLAFGREAMGLGDVHLLAAVGAVLGWFDPILIFFIAPFSGIVWAIGSMGLATIFRTARRELPYGPHLALATVVVVLGRPGLNRAWTAGMPGVPMPKPGLVAPPASAAPGPVFTVPGRVVPTGP